MQKDLRIVIIGAGMAGILAAIKLLENNYKNFTLYEKADQVGGTWRDNSYPGLTCDVPSHHYTYSFERNPAWSRHYSPGPEIKEYFQNVFKKYNLQEYTKFGAEVKSMDFISNQWHLGFADDFNDTADVVIGATGVLHHPKMPDIAGIESFQGHIFHSSKWQHELELENLNVGVIGNGSSGVQIVGALGGECKSLFHFQRTAQWMMPLDNGIFSSEEQVAFQDPKIMNEAMQFDEYFDAVNRYSQALLDMESDGAKEMANICKDNLIENVKDVELRKKLTPDHRPLCKRLVWSSDYYPAIQHPKSELVVESISEIVRDGIVLANSRKIELDVIVLATGFKVDSFLRPINVKGLDAIKLNDYWSPTPKAYLSISLPKFPNLFLLNGPNGPVGNFSLIDIAEHQMNYILQLISFINENKINHIEPKHNITEEYEAKRAEAAKKTVWYQGGCNSWYLNDEGIPASWPWTYKDFVEAMKEPKLENFSFNN